MARLFVLRGTLLIASLVVCHLFASSPLSADDLSRWVWVAQAPDRTPSTETIATPQRRQTDCPTLDELGYKPKSLVEMSLDVGLSESRLPADCSSGLFSQTAFGNDGRAWMSTEFNWEASDLFAQPAYFDDPVLERSGKSRRPWIQPWLSGAHFFSQFPLLPYKVLVDRPCDKVYTLGYQRPGSPH